MRRRSFGFVLILVFFAHAAQAAQAAFSLTPGHYYTANDGQIDIQEFDHNGVFVGQLFVSSAIVDTLRGLAFGPNGWLYAAGAKGGAARVVAIGPTGVVLQTYANPTFITGNGSSGNLFVDALRIYVAAGNSVVRFNVGLSNSGTALYTQNQVFDVKKLPNDNLLVASAYDMDEITPDGEFVRHINPSGNVYTDIRGAEYDPATDKMFVSHLGHTDFDDRIMRVNFSTGELEANTIFHYPGDIFLTDNQKLLVGSRTEIPRFYDQNLNLLGTLGSTQRKFVTQYVVPEPSAIAMTLLLATALAGRGRRRC